MGAVNKETTDIIPVASNILNTDLWTGRDIQCRSTYTYKNLSSFSFTGKCRRTCYSQGDLMSFYLPSTCHFQSLLPYPVASIPLQAAKLKKLSFQGSSKMETAAHIKPEKPSFCAVYWFIGSSGFRSLRCVTMKHYLSQTFCNLSFASDFLPIHCMSTFKVGGSFGIDWPSNREDYK